MRRLRIGIVCPYSIDVPGGVQNHVRDLAGHLTDRGHRVAVLAPGERPGGLPYLTTVGKAVPVRFNGSVARLAFGPRVAAKVRRWLAESDLDVLHVHEPTNPSVSLIALWASEGPVVATFHTAIPRSRAMSSTASLLRPSLEKISARIAVSEAARETLVQHYGGEPVVIPNGVSCQEFAGARPRSEWADPGPTLAFLGRTDEPRKGLAVLAAALPRIVARHPAARLLVAGRGDPARLTELVPEGVRGHVEFLGQVSDEERRDLLASVTAYVAPQTGGESFGIVLVEAMAAGAAVVASDLPAFRAVLGAGEYGELFTAGDPAAAAAAVNGLLADPERLARLQHGGPAYARRYDWSRLVGRIESVYEVVVRREPRHQESPV